MWSPLARVQRLLDYELLTIPPPLLTPIPRFTIVGGVSGFIVWCVAGAPLAIFQGLCLGLLVASPFFGPERTTVICHLESPIKLKRRVIQVCSAVYLVMIVAVVVGAFLMLPLVFVPLLAGAASCLFLCLTGLVNLVTELLRILAHWLSVGRTA
ncbi:MAG TPA: hypothetical protein VHD36_02695 [Pirellulales bacterium]|nr:hypothetical protein [Pirellulales bacterium]